MGFGVKTNHVVETFDNQRRRTQSLVFNFFFFLRFSHVSRILSCLFHLLVSSSLPSRRSQLMCPRLIRDGKVIKVRFFFFPSCFFYLGNVETKRRASSKTIKKKGVTKKMLFFPPHKLRIFTFV